MVNQNTATTRFEMSQLPQEVAKEIDKMKVGEISKPFIMMDRAKGKEIVAIVRLRNRIEGHKANMSDDYQELKSIVEAEKKNEIINNWIKKKQSETYIRINDGWRNCDFQYDGWIKK